MRACRTIPTRLPTVTQQPRRLGLISLVANNRQPNMSLSFWNPHPFHSLTSSHPTTSSGFSSLFRMLDDFEKYAQHQVGSLGGSIPSPSTGLVGSFAPKFDVTEREKEYELQGELPGVPAENVEIEFTDPQTLVIRGHAERKHTEGDPSLASLQSSSQEPKKIESGGDKKSSSSSKKESKNEETSTGTESQSSSSTGSQQPKYWLSERSYGQFSRVFNFPSSVDQNNVTAKFNNGVLDIKVPKIEKQGGRKITVS